MAGQIQSEGDTWMSFKCAKCFSYLQLPEQLPVCLHMLCLTCMKTLEVTESNNVKCPKCKQDNPHHQRLTTGLQESVKDNEMCDACPQNDKKRAVWNCIVPCGKNLCSSCKVLHPPNSFHKIQLIVPDGEICIYKEADAVNDYAKCPVCDTENCYHLKLLTDITSDPAIDSNRCNVQGHEHLELKFFCKKCWTPVCRDCSCSGNHKTHIVGDLEDLKEFLSRDLQEQCERLRLFWIMCNQEIDEENQIKERLIDHVEKITRKMEMCRNSILEQTTKAFNRAVRDAELQGRDIMTEYKEKLAKNVSIKNMISRAIEILKQFLNQQYQAMLTENRYDISVYIKALKNKKIAAELISLFDKELWELRKPKERRLVLPDVKVLTITPPPLARVGTEWKQMKPAFTFKLHSEIFFVHSIVVSGSEDCLLSCRMSESEDMNGAILQYRKDGKFIQHKMNKGKYYISRLKSGEIVASYTGRKVSDDMPQAASKSKQRSEQSSPSSSKTKHAVLYCDGSDFEKNHFNHDYDRTVAFKEIKEVSFEPYGIATTADNKILLCCMNDSKKQAGESYLALMTLQGKVLKEVADQTEEQPIGQAVEQPQRRMKMQTPYYVAVSDSGEICVSDTVGHSIFILDDELNIKERIKYELPTSLFSSDNMSSVLEHRKFQPFGICYDQYGRIIVADPINQCVVRLVRNEGKPEFEPLLLKTKQMPEEWLEPELVAMSRDSRLWVVCRKDVFVFNYCT